MNGLEYITEIARAAGFDDQTLDLLAEGYEVIEDPRVQEDSEWFWQALCASNRAAVHPALAMAAMLRGAEPSYREALRERVRQKLLNP